MKKTLFLLVFLLSFSLAWAVSLETGRSDADYNKGEVVQIDVKGCGGISILQVSSPTLDPLVQSLVTVEQGSSDWHTIYNTNSEAGKGKYGLSAYCEDGTTATKFFCVDALGCATAVSTTTTCGTGGCNSGETCSSCPSDCGQCPSIDTGGHSRSGGSSCWANWSCSNWELCGRNLTQKRTCRDQAGCEKDCNNREECRESRSCTPCDESWSCTIWSGCQYGQQVRKCYDERFCDTFTKKPLEQKACQAVESGFVPSKIIQTSPDQFTPPKKTIPRPTFWDSYGKWLIGILGALIVLGLVIFLYFHFHKKRGGEVTNSDELKSWAEKELDAGKDENRIKEAAKRSGWTEQEVDEAFASIGKK